MKGRLTTRQLFLSVISLTIITMSAHFGTVCKQEQKYGTHAHQMTQGICTYETGNGTKKQRSSSKNGNSGEVLSYAKIGVILAYMRTGSSLAGATLQAFPKSFYLFEPMISITRKFQNASTTDVPVLYPNGTILIYKPEDGARVILQELRDFMTCSFGNLSVASLSSIFLKNKSKPMAKLRRTTIKLTSFPQNQTQSMFRSQKWIQDLEEVQQMCRTAPIILVKLIRIKMVQMKYLMPQFPNLKILHLNRDPRAVYNSRASLYKFNKNVNKDIIGHCERWSDDITITKDITKAYPGRLKRVRYEDIAQYPEESFKVICDFFGVQFEPKMKAFLRNITSVVRDKGVWTVERANPYSTAMRWRIKLNFTLASYVSKLCEIGMNEFNYYVFSNPEDMIDPELPVRGPLSNSDGNSITV